MAPGSHAAVTQELLVRYLDYWVPAALHSGRGAVYLDRSVAGAAAAVQVGAEFADLLGSRELRVLAAGPLPADPGIAGLRLGPLPADLPAAVRAAGRTAVFARLESGLERGSAGGLERGVAGGLAGGADAAELAALGAARDGEVLLVTDPVPGDARAPLHAAGFGYAVAVELVDRAGAGQLVRFATSALRSLERFKDELWAVDEYAGVRYRDPAEPDAVPLDISYEPHPGSLRRALLAHLAGVGPRSVTELREFALARTLYRAADVPRALAPLLSRGAVVREPAQGRMTGATRVQLAG